LGVGDFVKLLRSVDRLVTLEAKHGKAIEKLEAGSWKPKLISRRTTLPA